MNREGYSPPSSTKRLQRAIVDTRSSDAKLVRSWSLPKTRCPSASEHCGGGRWIEARDAAGRVETGFADFAGPRHWFKLATSLFAELLFTVQPKIDDLELERPIHGAANARTSMA